MNQLNTRTIRRAFNTQLVRYAIVGIFSNSTGYLLYLLFTFFGATPKITMSFLYAVGATISFLGNRRLTFAHRGHPAGPAVRFAVAHGVGYGINFLLLYTLVDIRGFPHEWVQFAAIFIVAAFLFVALKYFVFPKSTALGAPADQTPE